MAKFITLHTDGKAFVVNADLLFTMSKDKETGKTAIFTASSAVKMIADETTEQIINLLNN